MRTIRFKTEGWRKHFSLFVVHFLIGPAMHRDDPSTSVTELYKAWGPSLLRYAAALSASIPLAEDLVNESFLELHRNLAEGVTIHNPRAWTLTVVRNLLHKHRRGTRRIVEFPNLEKLAAPPVEHLNDLRRLLHQLTEREQQVLLLRMDSLKYHEIAEELQIAPGTVAALLSRALSKLRQSANPVKEVGHGKAL